MGGGAFVGCFLEADSCCVTSSRVPTGHPAMPVYWALGYHLCRWGYGDNNSTWEIVKQIRNYGIPQVKALVGAAGQPRGRWEANASVRWRVGRTSSGTTSSTWSAPWTSPWTPSSPRCPT